MVLIPTNRKYSQTNSGEVFGVLHSTKNINFDKTGYAQLSKRAIASVYNVTNFETLVSLTYLKDSSNSGYYAMTAAHPFRFNLDGVAPTDLNGSGHTGDISYDGCVWQGKWYITQGTSFANYAAAADSWTTALGSLSSGVPHPICVWESANYLAIGNGNNVKIYDTSHTLVTTIVLPSNYEVRWIRYNHQRIYVGTKNKNGGDAVMFVCQDTTATSAADAWPVPANWLFSGIIFKSSVCVVTSRGQLLRFNGGGWDELANFPVYYTNYSWYQGSGYINGRVEQRGMGTDGKIIWINIDGFIGDANMVLDNQPSGIWMYDENIGLTHRAGVSLDKYNAITISSVNTTTDVFTASGTFTALTGVKVWYKATGTNVSGGLSRFKYYYLIRASGTTFKLASTYANAIAGTAIDITSAGDATETLHCSDELDSGGTLDDGLEPGAVCMVSELDSNPIMSTTGFGYMSGSQVLYGMGNIALPDGSGVIDLVLSLAPGYNRGYLTTQKVFSGTKKDSFKTLLAKCSRLFQTSDSAVVKYRVVDKKDYPISVLDGATGQATWVTSTSFTSSEDLSAVVKGEEVEFTAGRGAGLTAHVSITPTFGAGVWTITLDETIPGVSASDKSGFTIQNWVKLGVMASSAVDSMFEKTTGQIKKWISMKIELRGHSEPILEEAQVNNATNQ